MLERSYFIRSSAKFVEKTATKLPGSSRDARFLAAMYPVQEPAILDDIFPTEQVRSERVYDVAYCQGVLADLLPGTVAGRVREISALVQLLSGAPRR